MLRQLQAGFFSVASNRHGGGGSSKKVHGRQDIGLLGVLVVLLAALVARAASLLLSQLLEGRLARSFRGQWLWAF